MILYSVAENAVSFLENYGWYLLITVVASLYVYNTYLKSRIRNYWKWKSEQEYAAKYHKNSDLLEKRVLAQQAIAEKLQKKYNEDAEIYKRKLEEREAQKLENIAKQLEGKGGTKLGSGFKPEYNPLMGAGTSGGYRPPKKGCCKKGGGCG